MSDRIVLIAIHDVCQSNLPECETLARWIYEIDPSAPLSLLVVPNYHGREHIVDASACRRWLETRICRGDEVALHGDRHLDEAAAPRSVRGWVRRRVMTAGEGEFAALTRDEARERIERGLSAFRACGFDTQGFVPPAWAINTQGLAAAREHHFTYVTDSAGFHRLAAQIHEPVPVIGTSARSRTRRFMSITWLACAVRRYQHASCVRVALHPADARHAKVAAAWQQALKRLLQGRTVMTKATWLANH